MIAWLLNSEADFHVACNAMDELVIFFFVPTICKISFALLSVNVCTLILERNAGQNEVNFCTKW